MSMSLLTGVVVDWRTRRGRSSHRHPGGCSRWDRGPTCRSISHHYPLWTREDRQPVVDVVAGGKLRAARIGPVGLEEGRLYRWRYKPDHQGSAVRLRLCARLSAGGYGPDVLAEGCRACGDAGR